MSNAAVGRQSFRFDVPPVIRSWACVGGRKEARGPLGGGIDIWDHDSYFGQKTWEMGEQRMQQYALETLVEKAKLNVQDVDLVFSGDLLNQCIGSSFTLSNTGIPHLGLYGACSTMAEGMLMAAMAVGGGFRRRAAAMTSSHFASAERQYRFPLGYGGQRTPTSQWTVTGAGAVLVEKGGVGPRITGCTVGTVKDLGIKDTCNMGAAMAPAALSTILAHFEDFKTTPEDYDLIVTGDLGFHGKQILLSLAREQGVYLGGKLEDCGTLIYDATAEDVHAGGSGCSCSALVLCAHFLEKIQSGSIKKMLFCGTGALLSPTSSQQGLSIPGICHGVCIEKG